MTGKSVVVLGMGNSAMDIAVEASYVTDRRLPRRAPRRVDRPEVPVRQADRPVQERSAHPLQDPPEGHAADHEDDDRRRRRSSGCRSPTTSSARRTRRSRAASWTASRTARSRRSRTSRAWTATASSSPTARATQADIVVYCTGYKITFPFFDEDFISAPDNHIELYPPRLPPRRRRTCSSSACCSRSGRDHAAVRGPGPVDRRLPARASTRCRRASSCWPTSRPTRRAMHNRYVASKRHTIQVDFDDYLYDLAKERRRGAERARRAGFALPVAALAAQRRGGRVTVSRRRRRPASARRPRPANRAAILVAGRGGVRRHRLRRGDGARHRPPHRPRQRDVLQLLPGQGGRAARDHRADAPGRRARACAPRAAARARVEDFVDGALPRVLRLPRRGSAAPRAAARATRARSGRCSTSPPWAPGPRSCARTSRAGVAAGVLPPHDVDLMAAAMIGAGFEVGVRLLDEGAADVDGATQAVDDDLRRRLRRLARS